MPTAPPHPDLRFTLQARDGNARAACFSTPHGEVLTPTFMPVATRASVKGLTNAQIERIGPQVLLANTYHLHLRPGEARVRSRGGLHAFTGWDRPILTDSGGYQVFSLTSLVRVEERGVHLKSHLDGESLFLGPREAMQIQEALGADLVMAFDHCLGLPAKREEVEAAVDRTTRWARVCNDVRTRDDQALFGIVQGGVDLELRAKSAAALVELGFPGYAVGGLAVGEAEDALFDTLDHTTPLLPEAKPRYLMGVGTPVQILEAVARGVDLFDCVLPTRMGRRGHLFTPDGIVRITAREYEDSDAPLDPECTCEVCQTHSRAYLRHLFSVGEHTATTLGSLHNLTFYVTLLARAREAIRRGEFAAHVRAFRSRYDEGERAWQARTAADPEGRRGSQVRRAEQDRRRRRYEEGRGFTPEA